MRLDFTRTRGDAEGTHSAAGKFADARPQLGAVACVEKETAPLAHPLCASAPLREQKSKLSYTDMFTICSPRIGGQAHGA